MQCGMSVSTVFHLHQRAYTHIKWYAPVRGRLVPDLGLEGVQVHELEVAGDGLQRVEVRLCVLCVCVGR